MMKPMELIVGCTPSSHADAARFAQRWFLVDAQDRFCSHAHQQKLLGVQIDISHGNLVLRAPGMLRLDIPMDVIEDDDSVCREVVVGEHTVKVVDEGDLPAVWFGNVIGAPCRLVKVHPDESVPKFE